MIQSLGQSSLENKDDKGGESGEGQSGPKASKPAASVENLTQEEAKQRAKLISNTEAAVERGVFGIPTFFVGDEMYFGKDTLWQVEEALLK